MGVDTVRFFERTPEIMPLVIVQNPLKIDDELMVC